jgi:hypothetical protein
MNEYFEILYLASDIHGYLIENLDLLNFKMWGFLYTFSDKIIWFLCLTPSQSNIYRPHHGNWWQRYDCSIVQWINVRGWIQHTMSSLVWSEFRDPPFSTQLYLYLLVLRGLEGGCGWGWLCLAALDYRGLNPCQVSMEPLAVTIAEHLKPHIHTVTPLWGYMLSSR